MGFFVGNSQCHWHPPSPSSPLVRKAVRALVTVQLDWVILQVACCQRHEDITGWLYTYLPTIGW